MKIALIQQHAGEDRAENLERALANMGLAAERGARLAVFPEVALTRFFPQLRGFTEAAEWAETIPGPIADRIAARARELSLVTVFNMYERDERGRTFDSSPVFEADGTLLGITRMVHITDYEWFHEQEYYHPGDRGAPVVSDLGRAHRRGDLLRPPLSRVHAGPRRGRRRDRVHPPGGRHRGMA